MMSLRRCPGLGADCLLDSSRISDKTQAHSLAPPPPPIRARPTPMDEERKAPATPPEPPDEGDPTPVSQPSSNETTTSEIANSPNPKPCPLP
ncbi:Filamentous hemagglutinin, partial [Dissostichus eleginoides]